MTEELVEKVARGLHLSSGLVRDDMKTRLSLPYREMARAALASIQEDYAIVPREPTEAMKGAGAKNYNGHLVTERRAGDIYTAMISAAERASQ